MPSNPEKNGWQINTFLHKEDKFKVDGVSNHACYFVLFILIIKNVKSIYSIFDPHSILFLMS